MVQRALLQFVQRQQETIMRNNGMMMHENSEKRGLARTRKSQMQRNQPLPSWESYRAQQSRDLNLPTYNKFIRDNASNTGWRRVALPPKSRAIPNRRWKRPQGGPLDFFKKPLEGQVRRLMGEYDRPR